jgi:mono/diheme cytochrome c family protein
MIVNGGGSMKSTIAVAMPVLMLCALGSASAQDAALAEKGKGVYAAAAPKCKTCHSIGGEGNPKGSLDGVGAKLKAEEVKAWLRTPKESAAKAKAERKPPMPAYSKEKIADEDLEALTAYLLSLKK